MNEAVQMECLVYTNFTANSNKRATLITQVKSLLLTFKNCWSIILNQ